MDLKNVVPNGGKINLKKITDSMILLTQRSQNNENIETENNLVDRGREKVARVVIEDLHKGEFLGDGSSVPRLWCWLHKSKRLTEWHGNCDTYCININFLVLILYEYYVRCNYWRKLGQTYMAPLCANLATSCDCIITTK